MARCIFDNLTIEQARVLADWYEGQGEQDAQVWFEENDVETPFVEDVVEKIDGDVIVNCR